MSLDIWVAVGCLVMSTFTVMADLFWNCKHLIETWIWHWFAWVFVTYQVLRHGKTWFTYLFQLIGWWCTFNSCQILMLEWLVGIRQYSPDSLSYSIQCSKWNITPMGQVVYMHYIQEHYNTCQTEYWECAVLCNNTTSTIETRGTKNFIAKC